MDLRKLYRERPAESRKGDYGRVVVAGGSERYAGAPAFNALASLRAGADLCFVVAPRRAADLVASYAPDLITFPSASPWPDPDLVAQARPDALVLGGGVERTEGAHDALRRVVAASGCPMVLDAEALHAIAGREALLRGRTPLLTPHGGEYEKLSGERWPTEEAARKDAARALARRYHATVVVKGRFDVVSDGERVHVDPEGSPFLTKGGYGDLLAGACGALLARGASPFDAAVAGTWIVGRAGALAARELGESTFASDALARVPAAIREGLGTR
jgi:NAD(P)H-hydrate epimerase